MLISSVFSTNVWIRKDICKKGAILDPFLTIFNIKNLSDNQIAVGNQRRFVGKACHALNCGYLRKAVNPLQF